jgi:hypothetical protein
VSGCGVSGLTMAISSSIIIKILIKLQWEFDRGLIRDPGRLYLITVRRNSTRPTYAVQLVDHIYKDFLKVAST